MTEGKRPLKVFLCHASQDKPAVRELYWRLVRDGLDVWLDETNLLPGMDWQMEIPKAVRSSDVIVICLSNQSVTKEGYVQKEIRFALDVADEKPDGTIFLIPVRLNLCEIPSRLARWQWVDLFSSDGYRKLRLSLRVRADSMGKALFTTKAKPEGMMVPPSRNVNQNHVPVSRDRSVEFGVIVRLFALFTLFVLTCAGIFWAGKGLVNIISQPPATTVMPSASLTPETPAMLQPETPTLMAIPSETQVEPPTPFQPVSLPTSTVPPIPTMTFTLMSTQTSLSVVKPETFNPPPMSLIPAGSSVIGSGGDSGSSSERPIHSAYIDAFYMDQFEVTNAEYAYCVRLGVCEKQLTSNVPEGYDRLEKYGRFPVVNVSWNMAQTYCNWRGARLPTEAEWEKAARGGIKNAIYPWGNDAPTCTTYAINGAQLSECTDPKGALKVGSFQPNGYQLFDMIGNVSEWVSDWYQQDYYALGAAMAPNPTGPATGTYRVVRGGSWYESFTIIESLSVRGRYAPESQRSQIGFRCARDVTP